MAQAFERADATLPRKLKSNDSRRGKTEPNTVAREGVEKRGKRLSWNIGMAQAIKWADTTPPRKLKLNDSHMRKSEPNTYTRDRMEKRGRRLKIKDRQKCVHTNQAKRGGS